MRKLLPILSALVLAAMMVIPVHALAEEDTETTVRISVGSTSGEVGDEVDVPVMLYDCEHVDSIEFNLNYDPDALSVVSVTPGDLFPAEYCVSNSDTPGYVSIACACIELTEDSGTILTVRFEILSEAGSALTVTTHKSDEYAEEVVSYVDEDYNQYFSYVTLENGSVTVGSVQAPDPIVTPWVPATPVPTPSPTPEATEVPITSMQTGDEETIQSQPSEAGGDSDVEPVAYFVVGGLFIILIVLIVITVVNRRKANKSDDDRSLQKK